MGGCWTFQFIGRTFGEQIKSWKMSLEHLGDSHYKLEMAIQPLKTFGEQNM